MRKKFKKFSFTPSQNFEKSVQKPTVLGRVKSVLLLHRHFTLIFASYDSIFPLPSDFFAASLRIFVKFPLMNSIMQIGRKTINFTQTFYFSWHEGILKINMLYIHLDVIDHEASHLHIKKLDATTCHGKPAIFNI